MIIGEEWFRIARESHSRVARKILLVSFFPEGARQLERFLGEDSVSGCRIGLNHDFSNGTISLGRSVEQAWLQDR
jgi:hypothetical protein